MAEHRIYSMAFAKFYPMYVQKVEKKGKTKEELDSQIEKEVDCRTLIGEAKLNPNRELIKGVVCGVRVEEVEEPLMRELRYMDKLVDELARGKKMESILRKP